MGSDKRCFIEHFILDNFNPRSPHGERPPAVSLFPHTYYFNPRSPHGERLVAFEDSVRAMNFNPRSPHGERPFKGLKSYEQIKISIHAPRMGSDSPNILALKRNENFNPRSPHGERRFGERSVISPASFQSTLPAWGATSGELF